MAGHYICILFQDIEQDNVAANMNGMKDPASGASVLNMTSRL